MKARLYLMTVFIGLVFFFGIMILSSVPSVAQTVHNEAHKMHQAHANKLAGCLGEDIRFIREGRYESGNALGDRVDGASPVISAECARPDIEYMASVNIGGGSYYDFDSSRFYIADIFNGGSVVPSSTNHYSDNGVRFTANRSGTVLTNQTMFMSALKYWFGAGTYEIVGYYRPNGCDWSLSVNGTVNTGDADSTEIYARSYVFIYDGAAIDIEYSLGTDDCPMIIVAADMYRVNR